MVQPERPTKHLWVLGAHIRPFARAVRARGFDPEQALLRVGLTLATLEDPYERIPRARFLQFLGACQDLTADADLGLHAGELARVEDFDISGLLMRSSPSVSAFYGQLDRRDEASERRPDIVLQAGAVTFRQRPQGAVPTPRIVGEYFTAMVITGFTLMTGPVEPIEVRFLHPRPLDTREHERIFRAPLRFEAGENAVVLPAEVMSRPMKHADAALARVLRRHVERMRETFAAAPDDLPERVRHLLAEELPAGRITIRHIAARLHQSESTLRRRLRERDTSYQALLDELRRDLALHYVREPRRSVTDMTRLLGFSDTGAFYRAFKRWTGTSVSEYRRNTRSAGTRA